jgi:hypothetical protein
MAAKNATPDVNAFVSSFSRNKSQAAAEPASSAETNSPPEPEPSMQASSTPEAPAPILKVERSGETESQKGRKEPAPVEQSGRINYAETFLAPVRTRKLKAVYMDEDTHNALAVITQASDGIPLADLLINIINHHFESYGPDIRAFVNEQEKKNKKRLPY